MAENILPEDGKPSAQGGEFNRQIMSVSLEPTELLKRKAGR